MDKKKRTVLAIILIGEILFLATLIILLKAGVCDKFDKKLLIGVNELSNNKYVIKFFSTITHASDMFVLELLSIILLFILKKVPIYKRCALIISVVSASYISILIKDLVYRIRPDEVYRRVYVEGSSFPSGHSCRATAFFIFLLLYIKLNSYAERKAGLIISIIFSLILIYVSRIILGVHYFTDVFAGFLIGSIIAILTYLMSERSLPHRRKFY